MRQLLWRGPLGEDGSIVPGPELRHRLRRVLRLRAGAELVLADGGGGRRRFAWSGRELLPVGPLEVRGSRAPHITLAAALLKGDRWLWLVEKAVEVGADRILPLRAAHCVVKVPAEKLGPRLGRWRQRAVEAFEQCGRPCLPTIEPPAALDGLVARHGGAAVAFCHEAGGKAVQRWCRGAGSSRVVLVVGPEGGLSDQERATLRSAGAAAVSLGKDVLRAETAAIVAVTLARAALAPEDRP